MTERSTDSDSRIPQGAPPGAHDAPGLSPFERMAELTRRLFSVPPKELAREKRKDEKKRGH